MRLIRSVRIQCYHCRTRFAPPIAITDMAKLEEFAAWGGIIDCVHCHHFVEVSRGNLSYVDGSDDAGSECLTRFSDSRKSPTAGDSVA